MRGVRPLVGAHVTDLCNFILSWIAALVAGGPVGTVDLQYWHSHTVEETFARVQSFRVVDACCVSDLFCFVPYLHVLGNNSFV